ncbi:MAG TPA: FAD-dependent oxidoreductase [Thermomicrobiales bacterium]|nr:FAD-dependent oxidoreductase [Thermomicrobiales bacterium]
MKDYASYSFWLETCGDDLTPRARLDGSAEVDVAILGAGFTGLWSAYYLLQRDPSLRIGILEREIAGFGASGRNGGWCYPGFPVSLGSLRDRYGPDVARDVAIAMHETVDEVGRVLQEEGIDAEWHEGGLLRFARGAHQLPSIDASMRTTDGLGLGAYYQRLSADETRRRVNVTDVRGAVSMPHGATVHPGRMARGLARAVERKGATIWEQTPVVDYVPGRDPRFLTPYGEVRAKTLLLAGEAYLTQLPKLRRAMIPVYSLIILTEPLGPELWEQIGWRNRELLSSSRYSVDYVQQTADARILFGGRGAPYRMGSLIADPLDRHEPTHAMLRRLMVEWFPMLKDTRVTHAWGGPLGMPRDWMPTTSYDAAAGVARAGGYTGSGVATTNLFGRVMADLITGTISPLTRLPTVNHRSPDWEPEPLRWLGIRYVQEGFKRLDERAQRTGVAPSGRSLVEKLGEH